MTTRIRSARLVLVPAALLLGLATVGCGFVQNAIDTANTLGEFSDRLGKASELTYTAGYKVTGGEPGSGPEHVTLVQQPPNTAFIAGDGKLIITPELMTSCAKLECQQAPNLAGKAGVTDSGVLSGVAGPGFVTPELALGLVAAAALVPNTDVSTSDRTFAGQKALCADVTGIQPPPSDEPPAETIQDFSVCVTESGVLASFSGTSNTGDQIAIELVSFTSKADAKAFEPPKGANVVDVTEIQP
jgi:hypothetical protein